MFLKYFQRSIHRSILTGRVCAGKSATFYQLAPKNWKSPYQLFGGPGTFGQPGPFMESLYVFPRMIITHTHTESKITHFVVTVE